MIPEPISLPVRVANFLCRTPNITNAATLNRMRRMKEVDMPLSKANWEATNPVPQITAVRRSRRSAYMDFICSASLSATFANHEFSWNHEFHTFISIEEKLLCCQSRSHDPHQGSMNLDGRESG